MDMIPPAAVGTADTNVSEALGVECSSEQEGAMYQEQACEFRRTRGGVGARRTRVSLGSFLRPRCWPSQLTSRPAAPRRYSLGDDSLSFDVSSAKRIGRGAGRQGRADERKPDQPPRAAKARHEARVGM